MMEFADIFDDGITAAVYIYSPTMWQLRLLLSSSTQRSPSMSLPSVSQLHRLCSQPDACSEN